MVQFYFKKLVESLFGKIEVRLFSIFIFPFFFKKIAQKSTPPSILRLKREFFLKNGKKKSSLDCFSNVRAWSCRFRFAKFSNFSMILNGQNGSHAKTAVQNAGYMKVEKYNEDLTHDLAGHYHQILEKIGEDPFRDGLLKTPERVGKALQFLTSGYHQDAAAILRGAMFEEDYKNMVIVKDIELYSMCEHHMLPFFGKAHIAYIPNGRIVGLSKIPRVVDVFARRLQVQERLTDQILECIQDTLNPLGVAVVIEAKHMCMMMRGVQKQNSHTTTSAFRGAFEQHETRTEFLKLVSNNLH